MFTLSTWHAVKPPINHHLIQEMKKGVLRCNTCGEVIKNRIIQAAEKVSLQNLELSNEIMNSLLVLIHVLAKCFKLMETTEIKKLSNSEIKMDIICKECDKYYSQVLCYIKSIHPLKSSAVFKSQKHLQMQLDQFFPKCITGRRAVRDRDLFTWAILQTSQRM